MGYFSYADLVIVAYIFGLSNAIQFIFAQKRLSATCDAITISWVSWIIAVYLYPAVALLQQIRDGLIHKTISFGFQALFEFLLWLFSLIASASTPPTPVGAVILGAGAAAAVSGSIVYHYSKRVLYSKRMLFDYEAKMAGDCAFEVEAASPGVQADALLPDSDLFWRFRRVRFPYKNPDDPDYMYPQQPTLSP